LLENSAYKITPFDGENNDGPLKNAQPGFNSSFFLKALFWKALDEIYQMM